MKFAACLLVVCSLALFIADSECQPSTTPSGPPEEQTYKPKKCDEYKGFDRTLCKLARKFYDLVFQQRVKTKECERAGTEPSVETYEECFRSAVPPECKNAELGPNADPEVTEECVPHFQKYIDSFKP